MIYNFGAAAVTDTDGLTDPDVFSALDVALQIDLNVPVGATGSTVTVATAGGTATFELADLTPATIPAEDQGAGATDGVGGTLGTACELSVGPNSLLTVTGRIDPASDVDLYHLVGAEAGGILSVSAAGDQGSRAYIRVFDASGVVLKVASVALTQFVLPASQEYYVGYSSSPKSSYDPVDGSGTSNGY